LDPCSFGAVTHEGVPHDPSVAAPAVAPQVVEFEPPFVPVVVQKPPVCPIQLIPVVPPVTPAVAPPVVPPTPDEHATWSTKVSSQPGAVVSPSDTLKVRVTRPALEQVRIGFGTVLLLRKPELAVHENESGRG
jgi:hypothetical protein